MEDPVVLEGSIDELDRAVCALPNVPAVFLIFPETGQPYLARTNLLRRRLQRLLREDSGQVSRRLNLRAIARRIEYWRFASRLESSLLLYELARRHMPDDYGRYLKLRPPVLVRLILSNAFPRTTHTTRLTTSESVQYGPFRSRASAEQFEAGFLDFFQLRRCPEDLQPSFDHPGCVYGEMNKCLRPCQMVVSAGEYGSEAARVAAFLRTDGASLIDAIRTMRDRLSEELEFEEAARIHKRLERAAALVQGRDELATDVQKLAGAAVTPSVERESVSLAFFWSGRWHGPQHLPLQPADGRPIPLDRRVKEMIAALPAGKASLRERQDQLSLLAQWFYSSWRDGEWVAIPDAAAIPYRKIVNAIHRVAKPDAGSAPA